MKLYLRVLFVTLFIILVISQGFSKDKTDPNNAEYLDISSYNWVNYTQKDGLIYDGVLKINFDPQGYAWICTGNDVEPQYGGVSILTPSGKILSYTVKDGLPDNRVNDILFMPLEEKDAFNPNKGGIWFATGYGVAFLNRKGKWTIYDKANSDLPDNRVTSLLLDEDGNVWISTLGGGVAMVDPDQKWTVYNRNNGLAGNKVAASFKDKKGDLWFGIWDGGLSKFNGRKFTNYSMGNSGLVSNSITCINQSPGNGKMYFGTMEGLSIFDGKKWTACSSERNKFLISNFVSSLAFEANGNLWIGYWGEGVTLLKPDETYENLRFENSDLPDNHIGSIVVDKNNNKWFGTYKGFSILLSKDKDDPGNFLASPVYSDYYSFSGRQGEYETLPEDFNTASYHWQLDSSVKRGRRTLFFAIPIKHYGDVKWSYSMFWGQDPTWKKGGMDYSISQDGIGNQWAEFRGEFKEADFLSYGYVTEYNLPKIDPYKTYRFPEFMPDEVKKYLLPGIYLPSDSPDIYRKVNTMIKKSSKGDMYQTLLDILYSDLFRDMPYDYSVYVTDESTEKRFITETPKDKTIKPPLDVLSKNSGVSWEKARLFCSLCKSAGIPARLVLGNGPHAWSEVWINGIGWIPVESSLPVYDYGAANRLAFPKNFLNFRIPVSSFSSNDDDTKSIDWSPQVKATFERVDEKDLKKFSKLSQAKLLIVKPVDHNDIDDIPLDAMIPLCNGNYMLMEMVHTVDTVNIYALPEEKLLHEFFSNSLKPQISDVFNTDNQNQNNTQPNNNTEDFVHEVFHSIYSTGELPNDMGNKKDKISYREIIPHELLSSGLPNTIGGEPNQSVTAQTETQENMQDMSFRLLIYDESKKVVDAININRSGKLVSIRGEDKVIFEFIPKLVGKYLVMEILNWAILKDDLQDVNEPVIPEVITETNGNDNIHELYHMLK